MAQLTPHPVGYGSGPTSEVNVTQIHPLGTRGFDSSGNEYVYCQFGATVNAGEVVRISGGYVTAQLSNVHGWVGVADVTVTTANVYGWVMVRGVHTAAFASSDATSATILHAGATTDVGYPLASTSNAVGTIIGMRVTGDPDTCASTAIGTSANFGVATMILNYPWIQALDISS